VPLIDKFGRQIYDLRVSVTDRCNFRCVYCRSANPENNMAEHALLEWDEYERLVRILVGMGIRKVRVTGGEPLVRPGVEDFIGRLKKLGVQDLSMTTNGHLLVDRLDALVAAGLDRINISLDSLNKEKFEQVTRTKTFDQVIAGIEAAQASPLRPVKVNAVLVRGINDDEVEAFAEFAREKDIVMRFIEFMPLDADRAWTRDLMVPAAEVYKRMSGTRESVDELLKMMQDPLVEYTLTPKSIMKTAEFMAKVGTIKDRPSSWKDLFFSNVYNYQGS